ncbi:MAG: hypothetical protein COT18_11580 [Elusimicrobia bacterium CG08_land_8_20_14_0_20_59_10]|nr:MAG: hypothetical protein COT18_11580 [Elusimicrobia bacterium CG08_land_8_20_14_0_20_59_10]
MISIIIPAFNAEKTISKTLKSVLASSFLDFELIVVDDGSTDNTQNAVSGFTVRLIKLGSRSGCAFARNAGAKEARGEVLLFLDSDVCVRGDTVQKMLETLRESRADAAVAIYSQESLDQGFFQSFKALHNYSYSKFPEPQISEHTVFSTFCAMIRKDLFMELGGFDITYKSNDVEDYELGYRIVDRGYKLVRNKAIEVDHHFPGFLRSIKLYYRRTYFWTELFLKRKKFDPDGTSHRDAAGMLAGCLAALSLPAGVYFLSVPLFVFFMLCFSDFFKLAFRQKGAVFLVFAILTQLFLSVVVSAAACAAAALWLRRS